MPMTNKEEYVIIFLSKGGNRTSHLLFSERSYDMKYCPKCGFTPMEDEVKNCPNCGADVSRQMPYDYPQQEDASNYYEDASVTDSKEQKPSESAQTKTDKTTKIKIGLIVLGVVAVVTACICLLCFV